ncbi:acidic amino acid decarboxylase GADL1 [Orussus abietinus]|uniref:acidic amino acid decarboxylase GADL1 n=1 Tax=Orussus abietinus TaxID=222816 RepID=UPI000C715D66|nr:acidic amino acid decarboxylase GADL1 [Orussus abietinus]
MSAYGTKETVKVLEDLLRILKEEDAFDISGKKPVVKFLHPQELQETLPTALGDEGATEAEIEEVLRQIIRHSVRTNSPHFHNQLYGGVDDYGLAGAWFTEAFNTSQYTYEVAPVFTLLERVVIEQTLRVLGYPEVPFADGILSPGGSIANMYGIVLARFRKLPEVKVKGLSGLPPLALFTSKGGHYSIEKAAHWLGLGTESVHEVKTDDLGRMDLGDLKKSIVKSRSNGRVPFFVNATAGTTVLGAFDPISEIAEICEEEDLWLHVDACFGGTLLLSEKYRDRLRGIEKSDSVVWNPHKMLGAPLQCSLFLVKGKDTLHKANSAGAKYLFQQDKFYDVSWDTGDKSIQCGRKTDALKLWLMWKARGTKGLQMTIDTAMSAADYFLNKIKNREGFRLVLDKFQCCNVCFWYIPPSLRKQKETEEWWKKLYTIAPIIKERMIKNGSLMIGYTPLAHKNLGNFFRLVVSCLPLATIESMDYVVKEVEKYGADL